MRGYYAGRLEGERLRRVYELASPRVQQYLEAEIVHVLSRLPQRGRVLELGCGYGRVARRLVAAGRIVFGIDTAFASVALASSDVPGCQFLVADAVALCFPDDSFDAVVCVQNGICAFGVDRVALVREALRVVRPGGRVLSSSYAEPFWPHRLEWFERQAAETLVGEIDYDRSRHGTIVCRDGFRAGTMSPEEFERTCNGLGTSGVMSEVDSSSVFCEIDKGGRR